MSDIDDSTIETIAFDAAVRALIEGKPVVFPTDTVYGIGVSVRHATSVQALFDIKRRDAGKPVAWLVDSPEALDEFGANVPEEAVELARRHWPGALTIIVAASSSVPAAFRPQMGTIGLRMPANQTALALMHAVGSPLATTSANFSGSDAPREFDDVPSELLAKVAAYLQDDQPRSGVASTVIDCSQGGIAIVRQGGVIVEESK